MVIENEAVGVELNTAEKPTKRSINARPERCRLHCTRRDQRYRTQDREPAVLLDR